MGVIDSFAKYGILSNNMECKDNEKPNSLTGLVKLNSLYFPNIEVDKAQKDINKSKHYGFIIARYLLHEMMGNKKGLYSKEVVNSLSPISFKDKIGDIKFIDEDNGEDQYK